MSPVRNPVSRGRSENRVGIDAVLNVSQKPHRSGTPGPVGPRDGLGADRGSFVVGLHPRRRPSIAPLSPRGETTRFVASRPPGACTGSATYRRVPGPRSAHPRESEYQSERSPRMASARSIAQCRMRVGADTRPAHPVKLQQCTAAFQRPRMKRRVYFGQKTTDSLTGNPGRRSLHVSGQRKTGHEYLSLLVRRYANAQAELDHPPETGVRHEDIKGNRELC